MATQILVTGEDGQVPIHRPTDPWVQWALKDMYAVKFLDGSVVGPTVGANKFIPNIGDWIIDTELFRYYEVLGVDQFTGVATVRPRQLPKDPGEFSQDDILLGPGPGTQADTYRALLDTSKIPHLLRIERRCWVGGTMTKHAKIFLGGPHGRVIGVFYDQQGNLLGDEIPLELLTIGEDVVNYTKKTVVPCYTKETMKNGEVVTVVFYGDDGEVVSTRQCLVWNTAWIDGVYSGTKYVTGISLRSPYLSAADPALIQFPMNMPLRSLITMGVVHYSDGTTKELPLDASGKFSVFGFENFVATIVGQEVPLVLTYKLSDDEAAYGLSVGENKHISVKMKAVTTRAEGAYSLKLFAYPVWIDRVNGYRLEWFLYNLDRQTVYYVTPWVQIGASSRAFNPIGYGISQRLIVNLNLNQVDGTFKPYEFTQSIDITLRQAADDPGNTPWTIAFNPNQDPEYGQNVFAAAEFVNVNFWKLNLDSGATTLEEWLQKLYYNTKPLSDPTREAAPVIPNFFRVKFGSQVIECQLSQWNQELTVGRGLVNNQTLFIEFFRRINGNDLELAVAGLVIRQTNP